MKLPKFLKKSSKLGSEAGGDDVLRGTFKDAMGRDTAKVEAAERRALYAVDKMKALEQEKSVLKSEKEGLTKQLDSQLQQCDSLKKENMSLEQRLYAVNYKDSDEFVLDVNYYEKGQLLGSKRRETDLEHENNWLLPYSDFMTLLLVVFVVFYGLALTDVSKLNDITAAIAKNFRGGESGVYVEKKRPLMRVSKLSGGDKTATTQPDVVDNMRKEILSSFKKFNLGENLFVNVTKTSVTIRLSDKVTFYPGSSTLTLTSDKMLRQVARILSDYPGRRVVIEGHTDNIPISSGRFKSNWELSSSRAVSLVRYFVDKEKIAPERLSAMGFGQYKPIANNKTAEGRAANRRVEIKIQMK
jgi:chemotaxis protein MotB